jgi:ribosomal protein L3 glutamine methyltransferase
VITFRNALANTALALDEAEVFSGHGYVDTHDEAVALVLAAADLDPLSGPEILDRGVDEDSLARLADFTRQRVQQRLPTAYIIGFAALGDLTFRCDPRALVPRSPLMSVVLENYAPWSTGRTLSRIVDVCCGGGSLGLLAAFHAPRAEVLLMDIDCDALALAKLNEKDHGFTNTTCLQADLLSPLGNNSADIILANPPYVDAHDMTCLPEEYRHEPRMALAAGDDGLLLTHRLLQQAKDVLRPRGLLFLEVGNSAPALMQAYPEMAMTWLELECGGHGVCVISQEDLKMVKGPAGDPR